MSFADLILLIETSEFHISSVHAMSSTVLDGRISPGYGKTGRMAGTGQGGRFSLSGRHSAIEKGIVDTTLDAPEINSTFGAKSETLD